MKLYMKRNNVESGINFTIYNEDEKIMFNIKGSADPSVKMKIEGRSGEPFSTIKLNTFLFTYFTVTCARRMYILVPCVRERFAFAIYGSTYRFSGSLASGEFTMINADDEVIMTVKKAMTKIGEAFELDVIGKENRSFMISAAVCAASFQTFAEPETPQVCC